MMADGLSTISTENLTAAVTCLLQEPLPDSHVIPSVQVVRTPKSDPQSSSSGSNSSINVNGSKPSPARPYPVTLPLGPSAGSYVPKTMVAQQPLTAMASDGHSPRKNPLKFSVDNLHLSSTLAHSSVNLSTSPGVSLSTLDVNRIGQSINDTNGIIPAHLPVSLLPNTPISLPSNIAGNSSLPANFPVLHTLLNTLSHSSNISTSGFQPLTSSKPVPDDAGSLLQQLSPTLSIQNLLQSLLPAIEPSTNHPTPVANEILTTMPLPVSEPNLNLINELLQKGGKSVDLPADICKLLPEVLSQTVAVDPNVLKNSSQADETSVHPTAMPASVPPVSTPLPMLSTIPGGAPLSGSGLASGLTELQSMLKGTSIQQLPVLLQPAGPGGQLQLVPVLPGTDLSALFKSKDPNDLISSLSKPVDGAMHHPVQGEINPTAVQIDIAANVHSRNSSTNDVAASTHNNATSHAVGTFSEGITTSTPSLNTASHHLAMPIQDLATPNGTVATPSLVVLPIDQPETAAGEDNCPSEQAMQENGVVTVREGLDNSGGGSAITGELLAASSHGLCSLSEDAVTMPTMEQQHQDAFIFCVDCNRLVPNCCEVHPTDFVHVPDTKILSRSRASLPSCFYLSQTSTSELPDHLGVWCKECISERTLFGPVEGQKKTVKTIDYKMQLEGFNPYKLRDGEEDTEILDLQDENQTNWMVFVRMAQCLTEQNAVLYRHVDGHFYIITKTEIKEEEELLLWFSAEMCQQLGISQDPGVTKLRQCGQCEKYFTLRKLQLAHLKANHPDSYKWSCGLCGKKFGSNSRLHNHMMSHIGLKPHSCSFCQKQFSDRSNLRTHMQLHTGAKRFQCTQCDKSFRQKAHLEIHQVTHSGDKKYKCNYCDKLFARQSDLKTHTYRHTQELSFTCEICNKVFYKTQNYKKHLKVHSGERNYMCNKCFKGFQTKYHRDRHLKICKEKNGKESSYMSLEEVAKLDNT